MIPSLSLTLLVLLGVGSPAVLFAVLGGASVLGRPLPERWTSRIAAACMMISCTSLFIALVIYGLAGRGAQLVSYGAWSTSHEGGIAIEFLVDRYSLAFGALSA